MKIDPTKHQYGDYLVVHGHRLSEELIRQCDMIIERQIRLLFDKRPKIKHWTSKAWRYVFDDDDQPGGIAVLDSPTKIPGMKGVPVTMFMWKSKVEKL